MKEAGKIRHLGMSYHDSQEALDRILTEHPEVEFVQIALNYYHWNSEFVQARHCYEVIRRHNRQVIVMQPVKGGILALAPESAQSEMEKMLPDMTPASWAIACSQCGKCNAACPEDIYVSDILATYNTIMRQREQGLDVNVELNYYRPLKRRQHGGDLCDNCGKCNMVCPMQLDVMSELKRASEFQDEHSFW